ncbi:acyl-CoA dehydrogenase family protein [Paraburkholderia sp. DHOC27]|uniref:acyl-CoA dehydrogenase family protein n=1 Tax=Paraburkholderia sp. DHOC27 TaxID=2303330 RepID=UPI000E3D05BE|nr:acyl-CoA dehydrogenase family protein [Paraburkholderia sp. DHOC27]RFU49292.1 monooxygenase [Paraburkholderia sp. DHOC27]
MTSLAGKSGFSASADFDALVDQFRPLFTRIEAQAVERDRARTLPYEAIGWLKEAGFGALRVPVSHGGFGVSLPQLFQLIVELAAADSNLTQALRSHFAFVEDRLNAQRDSDQSAWFRRFVDGQIVGGAWTETGSVALGEVRTKVSKRAGRWVLDGQKYYSTGALFADWLDVLAQRADDGVNVIAVVNRHQPGVVLADDWDGFGQVGTGSGSSRFEAAGVEEHHVIEFDQRFRYQTAFYQLFHVATLAGIAVAAQRDAVKLVRGRTRVYSHGNAPRASDDAQIQQVIGEINAWAWSAEALAVRAAASAQRAYEAHFGGDAEAEHAVNVAAEIESAQSQLVVSDLTLRAATHLFDALGASATSTASGLDRHWRNARTVSSHNPLVYKARIVGDWAINGTEPPYVWQIGNATAQTEKAPA